MMFEMSLKGKNKEKTSEKVSSKIMKNQKNAASKTASASTASASGLKSKRQEPVLNNTSKAKKTTEKQKKPLIFRDFFANIIPLLSDV